MGGNGAIAGNGGRARHERPGSARPTASPTPGRPTPGRPTPVAQPQVPRLATVAQPPRRRRRRPPRRTGGSRASGGRGSGHRGAFRAKRSRDQPGHGSRASSKGRAGTPARTNVLARRRTPARAHGPAGASFPGGAGISARTGCSDGRGSPSCPGSSGSRSGVLKCCGLPRCFASVSRRGGPFAPRHLRRQRNLRASRRRVRVAKRRAASGPRCRPGTRSCSVARASETSPHHPPALSLAQLNRRTGPLTGEEMGSGRLWCIMEAVAYLLWRVSSPRSRRKRPWHGPRPRV